MESTSAGKSGLPSCLHHFHNGSRERHQHPSQENAAGVEYGVFLGVGHIAATTWLLGWFTEGEVTANISAISLATFAGSWASSTAEWYQQLISKV